MRIDPPLSSETEKTQTLGGYITERLVATNRTAGRYQQNGWSLSTERLVDINRTPARYKQNGRSLSTERLVVINKNG